MACALALFSCVPRMRSNSGANINYFTITFTSSLPRFIIGNLNYVALSKDQSRADLTLVLVVLHDFVVVADLIN